MFRNRLQLLKAAVLTRLQPLVEATNEAAADMIDEQTTGLVNRVATKVATIELTDSERALIAKAWSSKSNEVLQQTLFEAQNTVRLRFYTEVLQPEMELIHKFRFFAVLLDRQTYSNLVAKTASLFEAFSTMTAQVSIGLIKNELDALNAAVAEAKAAQTEYQAFGPTIEE